MSIIESKRIKLVKMDRADLNFLYSITSNKEVMKFFPNILSMKETKDMLDEILIQYEKYGFCFWKILLKDNGISIGIAGLLHQFIDSVKETEISYRLLPKFWKKGFATESAKLCKEYAHTQGIKRLISLIRPENTNSVKVAQTVGAEIEKKVIFAGFPHDIWVYQ